MAGPTYRENVTDKEQAQIEAEEFENSFAVFTDEKTRVITKANGAAERKVGGVVVPASDKIGTFGSDSIGRA